MADPPEGRVRPLTLAEDDSLPVEVEVDLDLDEIGRSRVPAGIEDAEPEDLATALEAVCFALNRPVTLGEVAAILGRSSRAVADAGDVLGAQLRGRGLMIQRHRDQLQLVTRPEVAWAVQRALNPERPSRLSRPALETLAIIAYRQPVTRAVLEALRGVNCDAVIESLERRGLVAEVGRGEGPGQPRLFGTTLRFLQLVGLERIEQLPPLPEGVTVPDFDESAWSAALDSGEDPTAAAQAGDDRDRHAGGGPTAAQGPTADEVPHPGEALS